MQIKSLLIASAALTLASAKVILTNVVYSTITAGQPFNLTWADNDGPVSLILRGAQPGATVTDPGNLAEIFTIDSNLSGTSYIWNVPANIAQSTYAIEIRDSEDNNYGALFEVIGGVKATTIATQSRTGSSTGTATGSATSTGTESAQTQSTTGTATGSRTAASTTASRTASSTPSASGTSAPAGGMASGLTSNLALVFVAVGALFMLN